ncbi:acyl-CoA dehydrogenase family protein [Pontibacter sp. G13]|uniref:acyl-CoA dehydrogenase family protein n=1 Tax=Pontibacter sp. G13 TaxID=3074898 RepID=UPI00288B2C32|nr:acyl-CoA dehydrogenase family protein [Pontibacter sp. G13]WNJ19981.1 acyl-CoA dehydrogenase family protein [Pontibacter sp. G13]
MQSHPIPSSTWSQTLVEIQSFIDSEAREIEAAFNGKTFKDLIPLLEEKRAKVKANGWWTPQIPQSAGGWGLSHQEFGQVSEILGRSPFGHYLFNCQAPDAGNMEILHEFGSDYQQETFLKPLLAGEIRSCFAMTEPEYAGSNPTQMGTTAILEGDQYVINGHKWFTTGADGASFAIVMAISEPQAENRYQRASQIIVPMDTPGVKLVRNLPVMGDEGDDYMSHGEVTFTDVRVPASHLLGAAGGGFAMAQHRLGPGRIHHCMRWIGICERCFEIMCQRAATRQIGPNRVLGDQQTIQNWIAESRANIHASRLMVLDAAAKMDAHGQYGARMEISTIKFFVARVLQEVMDHTVQVLGGLGMTDDTPVAHWFRHERAARIYDGADEVHKSRLAKSILKAYRPISSK